MKRRSCSTSSTPTPTPKLERKIVEKNRRLYMKNLCRELASLIQTQHHCSHSGKLAVSQLDLLEQTADYIKKTEERIKKMITKKRDLAMGACSTGRLMINTYHDMNVNAKLIIDSVDKLPMVELSDAGGSGLGVVLISSSLNKNVIMLSDAVTVLEEEGAEVLSTNQYFVADTCFHVLHCQAKISRVGYEIESIHKRLKELVLS